MLAALYNPLSRTVDIVRERGLAVTRGYDLETAITLSLAVEAPDPDPAPFGAPRRGFWGDSYDAEGHVSGSLLWKLEGEPASEETAQRAQGYATEALAWVAAEGHVRALVVHAFVEDETVYLVPRVQKHDGSSLDLGAFKVRTGA